MKQATVLMGLAALAAANAHMPHQHHHQRVRRGDDGVVTSWDIKTEVTVVTTTIYPGQNPSPAAAPPAGNPPQGGNQGGGAPINSSSQDDDDVNAQAVTPTDPNAIQAQKNAAQASKNAEQQAKNDAQMSLNAAHQSQMNAPAAPTAGGQQPAQTTPAVAQPTTPTQTQATQPAQTGGGSTGDGSVHSGRATYYGAEGGTGACGDSLSDNSHTVALSEKYMGSKQSCGKSISIQVAGGGTYTAKVADLCPGCSDDGGNHIDIPQGWAHEMAPDIDVQGHVMVQWSFI